MGSIQPIRARIRERISKYVKITLFRGRLCVFGLKSTKGLQNNVKSTSSGPNWGRNREITMIRPVYGYIRHIWG